MEYSCGIRKWELPEPRSVGEELHGAGPRTLEEGMPLTVLVPLRVAMRLVLGVSVIAGE